jgi:autotransporter-associated beta strand protein
MNDKRHSSYSSQATAASALLVHRVAQIFASRRFIRPGLAVLWGAVIAFGGAAAEAQWIQTGTGPFVYTDTANWTGGTINGNFSGFTLASSTTTQVVQFTGNYNLGSSMNFGYNSNIVSGTAGDMRFVASGADRTLNFGGLWTVNLTNNGSGSVISFGSTTANQRLNVALTAPTTFNSALSIDNNTGFVFLNDISGTQTITKIGTGAVILEGAATTSGGIAVREGQLNLSVFATLLNVPAVSLGGSTDITRNALLNLDNRQGSRAGGGKTGDQQQAQYVGGAHGAREWSAEPPRE